MTAPRAVVIVAAALALLVASAPAPAEAGTRTVVLKSKAFRLGGFDTVFPRVGVPAPKRTGYLVSMNARLVDARGRGVSIKRVMLHHVVFINGGYEGGPSKRTSCAGRGRSEPFWGTGEEKQPLVLPAGYGYRINARDQWRVQLMLMSHTLRRAVVRVEYRMRIVTGRRMTNVKPLWLRANGCATHPSYDIGGGSPFGSIHMRQHDWKLPLSGRIVASSAHLHGSSYGMTVSQPRCANRTLVDHKPLYGRPSDLVYRVRPTLHEPGPIATSQFQSADGIPVRKGERLRVTGIYDWSKPHPQVMAISHVYVAKDRRAAKSGCAALPRDARDYWTRRDGTRKAPNVVIPLNGLDDDGKVVEIDRPPGALVSTDARSTSVALRRERFVPANLSVKLGTKITWKWKDRDKHNVLLANGPDRVSSANLGRGSKYSVTMDLPGRYNLFCYLHPITMTQVVDVRP